MLDIDMAAPGFSRLVSADAPLDRIYHGLSFGEGPLVEPARRDIPLGGYRRRHESPMEAGRGRRGLIRPLARRTASLRQGRRLWRGGLGVALVWRVERDGSVTTLASHYGGKPHQQPERHRGASGRCDLFHRFTRRALQRRHGLRDLQQYSTSRACSAFPGRREARRRITDTVYPKAAFTPDESCLRERHALGRFAAYDMRPDGSCGPKRLFHKLARQRARHRRRHEGGSEGNVYCTGPGAFT